MVCRDEEMYRGVLDVTFDKFGIGYFMDKPENINSKPLVNFIRHAFDAVGNGFNSESILRMLKTGITKYGYEDISIIENYIFTWSPKWSKSFTQNINGFDGKEMDDDDKRLLKKLNQYEAKFTPILKNFKQVFKMQTDLKFHKILQSCCMPLMLRIVLKRKLKI